MGAGQPLARAVRAQRQILVSQVRRNFSQVNATKGAVSRWTGQRVFGIAAAAGLVGWGLAAVTFGRLPGGGAMLLDSKRPLPRYASIPEMEIVSLRQYSKKSKHTYLFKCNGNVINQEIGSERDPSGDRRGRHHLYRP